MAVRRRDVLIGTGAVVGAAAVSTALGLRPDRNSRAWAVGRTPTIVVIVADDMRFDYRKVVASLDGSWIDCVNAAVETPLCGPSRAALFRGMYSYRTGVNNNKLTYKMVDTDTIATRIKLAGYRTVMVGKYLNYYPWSKGNTYVPPGWDVWFAAGSRNYKPGTLHPTDYIFNTAVSQIQATPATTPLFVYLGPQSPHLPAKPPARYANTSVTLPPTVGPGPGAPAFNEADISDKPSPYNSKPLLTSTQIAEVQHDEIQIARSLLGMNDGLVNLLSALHVKGRLDDAAIFFTSDNGFILGEHRLVKKSEIYEEASRIPFMVRWPRTPGRTETRVVSSIDLSATVCVLAGAIPLSTDGKDLSPLFDQGTSIREAAYVEAPGNAYDALRTGEFKYAEHSNGGRELYDLANDPFEMSNVANNPSYATKRSELAEKLAVLRR